MRFISSSKLIFSESQTQPASAQCQKLWFITFQRLGNSPSMDFNSSSPAIKSGELKLNLFNELVEVVRKMWTILSARIPKWLILAETNLWEYFEDVGMGAERGQRWVGGLQNGRFWDCQGGKTLNPRKIHNSMLSGKAKHDTVVKY